MRRTGIALPVLVLPVLLSACGGSGGGSAQQQTSEPPPLAKASTAPPTATRPAGPVIKAACPMLKPAALAAAGLPHATRTEQDTAKSSWHCRYQGTGQYIELWVSATPATGSADQAAQLVIRQYTGTLRNIPGVGDAAYYTGTSGAQPTVQGLVAARAEGTEMRVIVLNAFIKGDAQARLTTLARAVLAKV